MRARGGACLPRAAPRPGARLFSSCAREEETMAKGRDKRHKEEKKKPQDKKKPKDGKGGGK